ncbi:FMN-dependent NADH-azoreductase [Ancylobacter lacus]|uniref:FMN-dependent NADH-azoreductase n=1 Tax=Ancylobacter lacus TaxID=2579970 RepID=UPI001BD0CE1B|nr:NAD(P)H-dependent oxidoreductase [Ancylobacter lacus]MBS7537682.1 NAD(P)H-dependent oxidoreductase [Ancylobacter lacus]
MNILHIDSSISGEASSSRKITAAVVRHLIARHPGAEVIYRDLAADALPHLTLADLADHALVDEFLAADTVVIGAPMYNFTVPTHLKAWLDRLAIAGRTFQYGANGPSGLAGGRKVIVASTRGGFYGPDSPIASYELQDRYLATFFGFIGITDITFLHAEGLALGPEQRDRALKGALEAAERLAV